jgi:hypothetical protein
VLSPGPNKKGCALLNTLYRCENGDFADTANRQEKSILQDSAKPFYHSLVCLYLSGIDIGKVRRL